MKRQVHFLVLRVNERESNIILNVLYSHESIIIRNNELLVFWIWNIPLFFQILEPQQKFETRTMPDKNF